MGALNTVQIGQYTAAVFIDESGSESPREWDNLGTFIGFHGRYVSPDTPPCNDPQEARRIAESADNICLRVWLYDHSGTAYRATVGYNPFTCPWDSGLFGFIYVSKKKIREEFGCKIVGSAIRQKVIKILQGEVETYSAWANGEVYAWTVADSAENTVESCGGYIGEMEYAFSEAKNAAERMASE
jgi:hypothetical protein